MARETWTDERLGDLAAKVDKGFADAKVEVRDLRSDMGKGFDEVKTEIRELRSELGAMQRTMIIGFATVAASTVGSVIAAAVVV